MKTNELMDEIRSTITPEMKMQMELSVAIANRIYEILEVKGMSVVAVGTGTWGWNDNFNPYTSYP